MLLKALKEWFRWKATLSWSLFGFLIGAATGSEISIYTILTLLCLLIGQGFIAHILNDIVDYKVDKIAKIRETKRSLKPIVEGWVSIRQAKIILTLFVGLLLIISIFVIKHYGLTILFFGSILFLSILFYNIFKLGWKPFAEWTTVFPTVLTVILIGAYTTNYKIVIEPMFLSYTFFAMSWFIASRLCDYTADKKMNKITTAVYLGIDKSLNLMFIYSVIAALILTIDIIVFDSTQISTIPKLLGLFLIVSSSTKAYIELEMNKDYIDDFEKSAGLWRSKLIYTSYLYALCIILSEVVEW